MRRKDNSVECAFHPVITDFLITANEWYRMAGGEVIVTSGSEQSAKHSTNSLHYAIPACAVDIRSWTIGVGITYGAAEQADALNDVRIKFMSKLGYPHTWLEIIVESDHIHIEFQPKRLEV